MAPLIQVISMVAVSALLVFWAWMFWEMTKNAQLPSDERSTWTLAFVFFSIFAAMYYYWNEYRNRY